MIGPIHVQETYGETIVSVRVPPSSDLVDMLEQASREIQKEIIRVKKLGY